MEERILGLHHITAIAGDTQKNYDFYTKVLGLRLVKKTVNFDDPGTYHLYYGDDKGSPGTILTFFPWTNVRPGVEGTGMATAIGYSIPVGSLNFWTKRFQENNVIFGKPGNRFGEVYLPFKDPDGLSLELIMPDGPDARKGWHTNDIPDNAAIQGFHSVTLTLNDVKPTGAILTDIFGYKLYKQEGRFYQYKTDAVKEAALVNIIEIPDGKRGQVAGGTNHHVAFRVPDENTLMHFRDKVVKKGFNITPKIDRNYFYSLYFREPGGVLFEIATDNPGFAIDESPEELGLNLKLPEQYEDQRSAIEQVLPPLVQ
ncbi:ring-cleaving dioxygenase [Pollutibacter soli]|uniref:ring-cleaving dioxygenase n=1 Tax=Pollutibacter soli TaxID=3034157 RepID=UPI003013BBBD